METIKDQKSSVERLGKPNPNHPPCLCRKCVTSDTSMPQNNSIHFIDNCLQPGGWKET